MPRQRYTLAQLKARLKERAGNNATFWTEPELKDALNEAISVWQALTGEWTTTVTIPALSPSPSFYPVPKQIVSLTRVGIDSELAAANPLGGTVLFERPIFESDVDQATLHTAWDVPVPMRFIPNGGVGPYRVVWEFNDGTPSVTSGLETIFHAFAYKTSGVGSRFTPSQWDVIVTVTDVTGDVFTSAKVFFLVDPFPLVFLQNTENASGWPTLTVSGVDSLFAWYDTSFYMLNSYNGDFFTNYAGSFAGPPTGLYADRYPMRVDFDFQPTGNTPTTDTSPVDPPVSLQSALAPVEKIGLLDLANVEYKTLTYGGNSGLRVSHDALTFINWDDGGDKTLFPQGAAGGIPMVEDVDNFVQGNFAQIRIYVRKSWLSSNPVPAPANLRVAVTDASGKKVTRLLEYFLGPITLITGHISFIPNAQPSCPNCTVHLINETNPSDTTVVTDSSGDYTFVTFPGFSNGDFWHIHVDPGVPLPCSGTDNSDSPHSVNQFTSGTVMTRNLDLTGL